MARATIEQLMRESGSRGAMRTKKIRTTVADPAAQLAPDLVKRQFTAARPDQLWVVTYVPMTAGFGHTAFVIDAFAGLIVGWECFIASYRRARVDAPAPATGPPAASRHWRAGADHSRPTRPKRDLRPAKYSTTSPED